MIANTDCSWQTCSWQQWCGKLNLNVRFVYVWCDDVKEMMNSLFESSNEVHAPGKQQEHLVCQHSMDDLLGHIVWIQNWEQCWPPERDDRKKITTSITRRIIHKLHWVGSVRLKIKQKWEASTLRSFCVHSPSFSNQCIWQILINPIQDVDFN